jgi:prophage regulatory protein
MRAVLADCSPGKTRQGVTMQSQVTVLVPRRPELEDPQPPPVDMLLSVSDVAELLSMRPRTVWRWAREGKIPAPLKLSRRAARWLASEMQDYLDGRSAERKAVLS